MPQKLNLNSDFPASSLGVCDLFLLGVQACSGGQLLVSQSTPPAQVLGTNGVGPAQGWGQEGEDEEEQEEDDESFGDSDSEADEGATADSMDAFCSVCHELFDSPVRARCGHVVCQVC